jgi:hypothetical protein
MRHHQIAGYLAAFGIVLCAGTSARAQGTQQERDACTPDVFRLCGAYIPDADRITACLRNSGSRLSQPCYDVFFPAPPPPQSQYAPPQYARPQYAPPQYAPPQYGDPRRRYQGTPPRAPDDDDD